MTFLEIPKYLIRNSLSLVHFEIRQKRWQGEEKKVQKEGFEGAMPKDDAPLKRGQFDRYGN